MQKIRDLTNQRFNNLVGIKYIGKDKQNKSLWLFKCDCGNEKIIRGTNVINGNVKSCGCKAKSCNFNNQSDKHINYNKNLHSKKLHNKKDLYKNNTSGHRGVSLRSDGRYCCYICINGKHFKTTKSTLERAIEWRKNMERKIKENYMKEKFLVRNDNGATILSCPNCKEELQIFFGEPLKSETTCRVCGTKLYYKNPNYEELVKEYEKEE